MGTEDVRNALHAMDDDKVRAQLAAGDLAALGNADLSAEEQAMVVAAADDFPEVAGFSFKQYTSSWKVEEGESVKSTSSYIDGKLGDGAFAKAVSYSVFKF
ncbi:MAG: hypothetical protein R2733_16595 [Acidimicrobiales bacterium]